MSRKSLLHQELSLSFSGLLGLDRKIQKCCLRQELKVNESLETFNTIQSNGEVLTLSKLAWLNTTYNMGAGRTSEQAWHLASIFPSDLHLLDLVSLMKHNI